MQAETIEDVFGDVLTDEVKQEALEPEDKPNDEKPAPSGYIGKEAWTESGKDPELWVSEDVFKERTLRIKNESRLKRELAETKKDFDSRLKDSNLLWQGQLSRQRAELMEKRDEAIDVADKATVKKLDKQIEDLDAEAALIKDKPAVQVDKPQEVIDWEEENPWVNDLKDPRTPIAQKAFGEAHAAGKSLETCLLIAEKAVAKYKPEPESKQQDTEIKKKPAVSMSDSSRAASSGGDSVTLSWNQLTSEERTLHEELFSHKTQKEYLKIVADARTGVKK